MPGLKSSLQEYHTGAAAQSPEKWKVLKNIVSVRYANDLTTKKQLCSMLDTLQEYSYFFNWVENHLC